MSKIIGVIPARYGSTRFPGKPLADIAGKPMLWWVYSRVSKCRSIDQIIIATDDLRIKEFCSVNNFPVIMTSSKHRTAANRLAEVASTISADYYVQINGDEPLIDISGIEAVVPDEIPQEYEFGTNVITEISSSSQLMDSSNIKVVFDSEYNALYMSRTPIPYPFKSIDFSYYKHVGIIGYNKKMLDFYSSSKPGRLELIEGIDTLRFIDYHKVLKLVYVPNYKTLSVDNEKDIKYVEEVILNEK